MKKLARLFLLCLMMTAIPLQGIAGDAMLCCAGKHRQSTVTAGESAHSMEHASDHQSHAQHADSSKAEKNCSCCADCCCCGGASATKSCSTPVSRPASEKITSSFSSHPGHISDGLERPPRN